MKIFISWSGNRSHKVAKLLDSWIQCVIQAVDPWLSSKDIDKGSLWFNEISTELSNTNNGILCLTKSNIDKPWILFEAGALAKGISSNKIFTLLIDLKPKDVKDPLAQFNHTIPNKDGLYMLIRSINNSLGEKRLKEAVLTNVFDTYYTQFDSDFKKILKETPEEDIKEVRPKDDILNEILYSVRGIDKRLRILENENENENIDDKIDISSTGLRKQIRDYVYLGLSDEKIIKKLEKYVSPKWILAQIQIMRNTKQPRN